MKIVTVKNLAKLKFTQRQLFVRFEDDSKAVSWAVKYGVDVVYKYKRWNGVVYIVQDLGGD